MSEAISAVILAAGRGTRLQAFTPKAYIQLHGRALLAYSLEQFARCSEIAELIVVIHPHDQEIFTKMITLPARRTRVVYGGAQRQDSSLAGVRAAVGRFVLVHDAARPCVSVELIERVIETIQAYDSAVPVIPIYDSLKRVEADVIIEEAGREGLVRVQTPQGFQRDLLLRALERSCSENRYFSDESGAVLAMLGIAPKVIAGDERNIKITTKTDLALAESLLVS